MTNAEYINPFISSTLNVLNTMCQTTAVPGTPNIKNETGTWGTVTGIIGMSSETLSGNLVLSFDKGSVLSIVSKMLFEKFEEITPDITDAVGEMTNMVCGGAKQQLSELGHNFNMASPLMISGQGVVISQLSKAPILQVPFSISEGKFVVELNLSDPNKNL